MPNRLKLAQEQSYLGIFWEVITILRTFCHTKPRNVLIQSFLLLLFEQLRNQCNLTIQISFECVQGGEIKPYRLHHIPFSQRSSKPQSLSHRSDLIKTRFSNKHFLVRNISICITCFGSNKLWRATLSPRNSVQAFG